eukprot:2800406-Prorocentrum_lima.AAC.1
MQKSYPFRKWKKDVKLWEISTSVDEDRKGPLLISQLRGTALTFMQEQMGNTTLAPPFQRGGSWTYPDG